MGRLRRIKGCTALAFIEKVTLTMTEQCSHAIYE
jgi:hypothetical protein